MFNLQIGVPGGPELLVVLLLLILLFGLPLVILVGGVSLYRRRSRDQLAELEARLDELEEQRKQETVSPEELEAELGAVVDEERRE